MVRSKQPWLSDAREETLFILVRSFFPVALVLLFSAYFNSNEVSTFWWVLLVLCVDVSHVYSTLFRLYWDRETFQTYKKLLLIIPLMAFVAGFFLHLYSSLLFWRILAYVAVFHFIRQQYGFLRLYSRAERTAKILRLIDTVSIYNATVYPILYWHVHATEKLAWFIKGDFIHLDASAIFPLFTYFYFFTIGTYLMKEIFISWETGFVNVPKNMIVVGTYLSWYVGIVLFQGDLIFTLLNVVAHGIPYMALIWIYGKKKATKTFSFNWRGVSVFLAVLLVLAYAEEFLWDGFVWKDHPEVFPFVTHFATIESPFILSMVVAVLVLPQVTHYILDGFIWRFSKDARARIQ
jgi:hypothetical protein